MDLASKILSDITVYGKYARYLEDVQRRETWEELVTRNKNMHLKKYPHIASEIEDAFSLVYEKRILPSMRSLQFAGKAIEVSPTRIFNCSFLPVDHYYAFAEIMFLLLGGTGVGFSVQKHHVEQLPTILKPTKRKRRHLVADSIEGWATAINVLMKAYFFGLSDPVFDFQSIRPKGTPLKTGGGRAPGPQPLSTCLHLIKGILDSKDMGDKLTPLEVHDIVCILSDAVLAGGIRRAALISLFSFDDPDMTACKTGNWQDHHAHRGRANNSANIIRHRIRKKSFLEMWDKIHYSGFGEPGIFFSHNMEWGTNPCGEVSLKNHSFCNLTTINAATLTDQKDFNQRCEAAAFIGTLQAGYTDFHFLRDIWRKNTEAEALIGVSMTGIASRNVLSLDLTEGANKVLETNEQVANLIGINPAARNCVIKPEGTTSNVLNTSSGVHAYHSKFYIRRSIILKSDPLYGYLKKEIPGLIEDEFFKPHLQAILSIPIKAPDGAILRDDETAIDLLERVKKFNLEWIAPGHREGDNKNNVSATVYVREDEWEEVGEWMWKNRTAYNGLAVFPYDGGNYKQAPFEEITKEEYDRLIGLLKDLDLTQVKEFEDSTNLLDQAACAGGACAI